MTSNCTIECDRVTSLLALLLAYSAGLIALGVWFSRRVRTADDFFVTGRSLGPALIFATFLAPNIGAASTVGATDLAYREGAAALWWNGSAGLGSLILALWIGPRMWREAHQRGFLTVGDFLEDRYGRGVRGLAAGVIWVGTLYVLCAQLDGIAAILRLPAAGGLPHWAGCLTGTAVMAAYFTAGGLASAARVNAIQLAVKLLGLTMAAPLAVRAIGGWAGLSASAAAAPGVLETNAGGEGWPLLFLLAPAFFLSPGLVQKAFSARDERALRVGVAWNGLALMLFAVIPVLLGLSARALFPDLPKDAALPTILASIPLAAGGLALAAVFSAELSAADASLFMLSTSGARDLYKTFVRPDASDGDVLRAARIAAVAGAALAYGLTFVYPTVLAALKVFYAILVVSLFAPILGGLLFPAAGRRSALAAMLTGLMTLFGLLLFNNGRGFGWATPSLLGLAASSAAFFTVRRRAARLSHGRTRTRR